MYCIYTNREISEQDSNCEHIIPLSLGGSNEFVIPVSAKFNSELGSKVDGELSNCFTMMFRRREHDARGHTKKDPVPIAKNSTLSATGAPVQVSFSKDEIKIFDPVERRNLTEEEKSGQSFTSIVKYKPDVRMNFTAKTALSGGYFVYGENFVRNAKAEELRMLMNFDRSKSSIDDFSGLSTTGWYSPHPVLEKDAREHAVFEHIAHDLNCSFLLAIPTENSITFVVAILGDLVGIMSCPASVELFPNDGDYDLGHAVVIKERKMRRLSFRELLKEVHGRMGAQ